MTMLHWSKGKFCSGWPLFSYHNDPKINGQTDTCRQQRCNHLYSAEKRKTSRNHNYELLLYGIWGTVPFDTRLCEYSKNRVILWEKRLGAPYPWVHCWVWGWWSAYCQRKCKKWWYPFHYHQRLCMCCRLVQSTLKRKCKHRNDRAE